LVSEICDAARGQRRAALRRSIGCPILRDGYYGLATFKAPFDGLPITRLALHASAIEIPQVLEMPAQRVEAPLAADLGRSGRYHLRLRHGAA